MEYTRTVAVPEELVCHLPKKRDRRNTLCCVDRQQLNEKVVLLERRCAALESTLTDALYVLADLARLVKSPHADVLEAAQAWQREDGAGLPF